MKPKRVKIQKKYKMRSVCLKYCPDCETCNKRFCARELGWNKDNELVMLTLSETYKQTYKMKMYIYRESTEAFVNGQFNQRIRGGNLR